MQEGQKKKKVSWQLQILKPSVERSNHKGKALCVLVDFAKGACQSYQGLHLWPKNLSDNESELIPEGQWRDYSWLSSGDGSEKGS